MDSGAAPVRRSGDEPVDVHQALVASGHAFAITDPRLPDNPLVWVNPAFEQVTGYAASAVLGRNCRFLQGAETDPACPARIRDAIAGGRPVVETMLNYRPDGTTWWNRVAISPVLGESGEITHFVGVQTDVTDRVTADQQRDAARSEAREARATVRLLTQATSVLGESLDTDVTLSRLADLVVPAFADWCSVLVVDPSLADADIDRVRMTLTHRDPDLRPVVGRVLEIYQPRVDDKTPQAEVLRTGVPILLEHVDDSYISEATSDDELVAAWRRLGMRSCIVVPLAGRRELIGCLTVVRVAAGRDYDAADVEFATDLARRAGLALENARLYAVEHRTALALQRSLLPNLPDVPGLELSASYVPGSRYAEVGGDWYDVLPLADGATGLAIGDVMGHDMAAAAAMGQVRSVLRSYAWEGDPPGKALARLDRLVTALSMTPLATCVYARIEPGNADRPARLSWANAGHPPPLLRTPDGSVQWLTAGHGTVLGIADRVPEGSRDTAEVDMPAGSTLLFYTDGLVEHRGRDLDAGLQAVHSILAAAGPEVTLPDLCERLTASVAAEASDDDVCLLAARLPERPAASSFEG